MRTRTLVHIRASTTTAAQQGRSRDMSYPTRHGTVPPGYEAPHRSVCATSRARAGQWRAARAEGGTDHPAMGRSSLTRARETAGRAFVAVAQPPWPHDQALSASACGVHPSAAPYPDQSRSVVRVTSESRRAPLSQRSTAQHSTAQHSLVTACGVRATQARPLDEGGGLDTGGGLDR